MRQNRFVRVLGFGFRMLFGQDFKGVLDLRLRHETFERVRAAGVKVVNPFTLSPGIYLVREVVRDNDGLVSSITGNLEIPF